VCACVVYCGAVAYPDATYHLHSCAAASSLLGMIHLVGDEESCVLSLLLQVWAGCKRGAVVYVWGVPVPSRFSWVPALALVRRHRQQPSLHCALGVALPIDAQQHERPRLEHTGA
jgi:hypothetical protein